MRLAVRSSVFILAMAAYAAALAAGDLGHPGLLLRVVIPIHFLALIPAGAWLLGVPGRVSDRGLKIFISVVAVAALVGSVWLALYASQGVVISDESAYRFQAKIFLTGKAWARALTGAPVDMRNVPRHLFFEQHVFGNGKWFAKYPPGWPLVLAMFGLIRLDRVANVVLAVALIGITARLAARYFGNRAAWWAALLCVLSQFFVANAVTSMAHLASGVLLALATWLLLDGMETGRFGPCAGAVGLVFLAASVRPFTAVVFALVFFCALMVRSFGRKREIIRVVVLFAAFGLAVGSCMAGYNWLYTGDVRLSPYAAIRGVESVPELTLNPVEMWRHFRDDERWEMEGTIVAVVPFLFVLAGYAVWKRPTPAAIVLAALLPALVVGHLAQVISSGSIAGNRFYFEGFFGLVVVAAGGLETILRERRTAGAAVWTAVLALTAAQAVALAILTHRVIERARPSIAVRREAEKLHNQVVFFAPSERFAAFHFNINRADWERADVVYLIDPGPAQRDEIARQFGFSQWTAIGVDDANGSAHVLAPR
jgi:hypothetical protein